VDKNFGRVAKATGKALEKGVEVTDLVLKEAKPLVKAAIDIGKKGARKARDETIKVAKSLRED
jgi:ribosomal protein L7/L12